eukprot:1141056-Pelagomonas_calceolata.AAC.5
MSSFQRKVAATRTASSACKRVPALLLQTTEHCLRESASIAATNYTEQCLRKSASIAATNYRAVLEKECQHCKQRDKDHMHRSQAAKHVPSNPAPVQPAHANGPLLDVLTASNGLCIGQSFIH